MNMGASPTRRRRTITSDYKNVLLLNCRWGDGGSVVKDSLWRGRRGGTHHLKSIRFSLGACPPFLFFLDWHKYLQCAFKRAGSDSTCYWFAVVCLQILPQEVQGSLQTLKTSRGLISISGRAALGDAVDPSGVGSTGGISLHSRCAKRAGPHCAFLMQISALLSSRCQRALHACRRTHAHHAASLNTGSQLIITLTDRTNR